MSKRNRVALMVKVWNEQFFLDFMLKYYDTLDVDAIFIFEGGSTDNTRPMLQEWVDRQTDKVKYLIFQEETHDEWFKERNEAHLINQAIHLIEQEGYEWIVKLDADELFTVPMEQYLSRLKSGRELNSGLLVPRYNLYQSLENYAVVNLDDNRWWFPDYNVRIFNVRRAKWRHPDVVGLDTQLRGNKLATKMTHDTAILHLHLLFPNRRNKRFATLDERIEHEYKFKLDRIPDQYIPDSFREWYNSLDGEVDAR